MGTRVVAATLWFATALYAGSMLHGIAGLNEFVGAFIGLMSAALIVADPFHRLASDRDAGHAPSEVELSAPDSTSDLPRAA
jgi:hypothetical protein